MRKRISALIFVLVALSCTLAAKAADAPGAAQVELQSYRFRKHKKRNFERLVLEFTRRDKSGTVPQASVIANAGAKEAIVKISGATLASPFPEKQVNDAYAAEATFLVGITVAPESSATQVMLKVAMKSESGALDAFWLENPSRLVLDVYRSVADKPSAKGVADKSDKTEKAEKNDQTLMAGAAPTPAKTAEKPAAAAAAPAGQPGVVGPMPASVDAKPMMAVAGAAPAAHAPAAAASATTAKTEPMKGDKAPASEKAAPAKTAVAPVTTPAKPATAPAAAPVAMKESKPEESEAPPAEPPRRRMRRSAIHVSRVRENYLCFPANAAVGFSVVFQPVYPRAGQPVVFNVDNKISKDAPADQIVCYPASTQVAPAVSFHEGEPMPAMRTSQAPRPMPAPAVASDADAPFAFPATEAEDRAPTAKAPAKKPQLLPPLK